MKQKNEKGQALVFILLMFAILLFMVGLASDGGRAYLVRASMARVVDAAAIAAAAKITSGGLTAAQAAACDSARMNGVTNCAILDVIQVTTNDAAGNPKSAVKVTANVATPTIFVAAGKLMGCTTCSVINVSVSAVAAGGGTIDLVMNLDMTGSMSGSKITNAKIGANALVTALMPSGSSATSLVSLVPFRGCYLSINPNDCIDTDEFPSNGGMIVSLTNDATRLHSSVNALAAQAGSGTNVCNGLKKARQKLFQSGIARPNSLRYLIILTDAENNFNTGLPNGSVDAACIPTPASNTNAANLNLGVKTNALATEIKNSTSTADGQSVGQPVKIFVIMYGPKARGSVPANCNASALSSGTADEENYAKNLARCIASTAGDVYLAEEGSDISAAFQQIINRLPVVLVN